MNTRPPPPLFVECYGTKTSNPVRDVVEAEGSVLVEPGRWQCEVSAPNGVRATLLMDTKDGRLWFVEMARQLRQRAKVEDLWVEPAKTTAPVSEDIVLLGAWSRGQQLEDDEWHVVEFDDGGRNRRIRIETASAKIVDHVQVAINGGPSTVIRYPHRGQLQFQIDGKPGTPVRAVVVGTDPTISAYWGFTRHAIVLGAYELGKRLADRSADSDLNADELIVVAHWLATHGIEDPAAHERVRSALEKADQTSDVRLMRWLLLARQGKRDQTSVVLRDFVELLAAIKVERPLYTETLRLFLEHLTSAVAMLKEHSAARYSQSAKSLQWVWSLASAMTWDTEHTGYRALTPGTPDPEALTVHIGERAKKKSAGWRSLP